MKIVSIFKHKLYAFQYADEQEHELRRLLGLWNDLGYLHTFVTKSKADLPRGLSVIEMVRELMEQAKELDEQLYELSWQTGRNFESFFKPLHNQEYRTKLLSKQKGRRQYLRIYALKIDENCFVITGGAIKFHHLNDAREHTRIEMKKLDRCRDFLKDQGVHDADSYFELLNDGL